MKNIQHIALELVRPGPAHNQLLSPLTPYVALCGGDSPVSVHLPFEHQQLLTRIQRLRYELETGPASETQIAQRQAELAEMGRMLGDVLGGIPALLAELSRIRSEGGKLVHLRLSLSASELGMVPFEMALSPPGFPGSGSPLFLQSHTPVTVTREIRRGRLLPLHWDRRPKILLAFASPAGLAPVPAEAHLKAIREAIDPWVKIKDSAQQRVEELKELLTVLPDATLQDIRNQCMLERYTHVHILAHGAPFTTAGDRRYGIVLCRQNDKTQWDVVDGESLAIALTSKSAAGATQFTPTVVSLATCDSGNVSTVVTPGGSVAHELHTAGIPWVVASQFPLWMRASTLVVHDLFRGLMEGEDPRWVFYSLRRRLRTDCPATHDWASIVTYATLPPDFEDQVEQFRDRQTRAKIEVSLNRLDDLVKGNSQAEGAVPELSKTLRATLARWRSESPPDPAKRLNPVAALRLGMSGACEKRLGIAYRSINERHPGDTPYEKADLEAYQASRDYYRQAIEADASSTWPITQYLCMNAIPGIRTEPGRMPLGITPDDWWFIAVRMARSEVETQRGAFALTDMVELSILGSYYDETWNRDETRKQIAESIQEILDRDALDPTPRIALLRQLCRYRDFWKHDEWNDLVKDAIDLLNPGRKSSSGRTRVLKGRAY